MDDPRDILGVIRELAEELHPELRAAEVTLDSSLERDLGLDSLARMELLARLERRFGVRLPEQILAEAETPRDLLDPLDRREEQTAQPGRRRESRPGMAVDDEQPPRAAGTLVEVLTLHAGAHPERPHILLDGGRDDPFLITCGELLRGAGRMAAGLQLASLEPGETVAIILPTSPEYFFSFFGVLLAGGIPVPLYPPVRPTQIEEHLRRHSTIMANAQVRLLITVPEVKPVARLLKLRIATLRAIHTVTELSRPEKERTPIPVQADDIACLQYTSGSTGDPKGVVLTHANLLANIRAMGQATATTAADVFVSWLPLYHDMGLIGAWLGSLYYGCKLVIMPPLSFLARPERWLWAIHNHGGTISASPNFGYELCVRRIADRDIEGLDLRSWRLAFNGAEPVTPGTVTAFCSRFAACGFQQSAMSPVYGLAESSVGLAFPPLGRGPVIDRIERDTFSRTGRAVPVSGSDDPVLEFVACGHPLPGHQIRIVDRTGRELPERREGRIQFKGPSATSGYYRNPDKTRDLFQDGWLEAGDRAYLAGGDVYVTGRIKDIIIRGGRNVYPHELEEAVGGIPGIRKGCTAVFGSRDRDSGTENLVVLAESRQKDAMAVEELRRKIANATVDILGMPPDDIVIAPPGTVLKTSSGKIRRAASRELYEQRRLGGPKRAVWLQIARLALSGLAPLLRKLAGQLAETLYAGYCWLLYGLLAVPVWLLVFLLPGQRTAWGVSRASAKLLALLSGTRLLVTGAENVPRSRPVIFAANHMSYLDPYVLQAVLPVPAGFIAKAELGKNPLIRLPLTRLGALLVERFDMERGKETVDRLSRLAADGRSLLFFPEGTFQRIPGLLPFRMGAFLTAVRAGVPVVPVTIRGTRNKLRSESWFPRRGAVRVIIGRPMEPDGKDWAAAVSLRDAVREEILRQVEEQDLAGSYTPLYRAEQTMDDNQVSPPKGER